MKQKRKKRLYHIYPAGNGNNVLYIDSIKTALEPFFDQTIFVSVLSPVKSKEYRLWFHPVTDILNPQSNNKLLIYFRYVIRYIEFAFCLLLIFIKCVFTRPAYVNLSTSTLLKIEYYFIKVLKALNIQTIYTIHDAQQFNVSFKRMTPVFLHTFYNQFSYLITHNDLSTAFLQQKFNISPAAVIQFPFPVMDLKKIKVVEYRHTNSSRQFLFIGHFRKEKGCELLIDAWKQLPAYNNAVLTLAGKLGEEKSNIEIKTDSIASIHIINKFLNDDEFIHCVAKADFVVLPYITGTNSGVLSVVMSLGKIVLCSDIPSFATNPLVLERNLFIAGNKDDLTKRISEYISYSDEEIAQLQQNVLTRYDVYKADFETACAAAFQPLLN